MNESRNGRFITRFGSIDSVILYVRFVIDLHVHSNCSDGTDSPRRLVELAASAGVELFALTDHDTLSGIKEASAAGDELGVQVITGTELSCHHGSRAVHLLAYFFSDPPEQFMEFLQGRRDQRDSRNIRLAASLQSQGIEITIDDVMAKAEGEAVGRPHFAAVLVERGYVSSIEEAFATHLGSKSPFFVGSRDLDATEAIEVVRQSGGATSWAHPLMNTTTRDEIIGASEELRSAGLTGLESWYSSYSPDDRRWLARLARRSGLVPTGGSDYHGEFKPGLSVGRGNGDLDIPMSVFDELVSAAK